MSIEQQLGVEEPTTVVGEQEAGSRADEVKRKINKLIKAVNTNMFDLAEYLHEAKTKTYYTDWGFPTYSGYAKSLNIKYTRAYYLVDIVEKMRRAGVSRVEYEPVGMSKLRVIAKLDPEAEYNGTPVVLLIRELTLKAAGMSVEEVQAEVDTIQGKVGDESMVWFNLHVKKLARENVMKPAIELARKHIGSQGQDEEGNAIDATESAAAEMIFANFLADPNYNSDAKPLTVADRLLELLNLFSVPVGTTVDELKAILKEQIAKANQTPAEPETQDEPEGEPQEA
jgi:hypothetical protein